MINFLKVELDRAYRSRGMLFALLAGTAIAIAQVIIEVVPVLEYQEYSGFKAFPHTLYEHCMGLKNSSAVAWYYYMFIVILATVPYAVTAYTDRKKGYLKNVLIKVKKKHYYCVKYITSFLVGGTVAVVPQIVNIIITAMLLPAIQPYVGMGYVGISGTSMWADIYYENALLYLFMYLVLNFIIYGLFTTLAVSAMWILENIFAVLMLPFLVFEFLNLLAEFIGKQQWAPYSFLRPFQSYLNTSGISVIIIALCMLAFNVCAAAYGIKKKDTLC